MSGYCCRLQSVRFTSAVNSVAAKSFNSNANLYNQVRPSYPVESVKCILSYANIPVSDVTEPCCGDAYASYNVLDLAAGSGLFTNVLHNIVNAGSCEGSSVVKICAVEPTAGMRSVFSQELPNVPIYDGSATSLPFPDDHFDLITVAQAFHWFANRHALAEIHRVLKKDGRGTLALIWNLESADIEWMKQLRGLYEPFDEDVPQYRKGTWEHAFTDSDKERGGDPLFEMPLVKKKFQTEMLVSQAHMMHRVESKSYITALPEIELTELRIKMHELLHDKHGCDFNIPGETSDEALAKHLLDVEVVMTKTRAKGRMNIS